VFGITCAEPAAGSAARKRPAVDPPVDNGNETAVEQLELQLADYRRELAALKQQHVQALSSAMEMMAATAAQPAVSTRTGLRGAAAAAVRAPPSEATLKLAKVIAAYDKAGSYATVRTDYDGFDVGPRLFPGIVGATPVNLFNIDVHVTLPVVPAAGTQLPVVFIFNCFAVGFQDCDW
jgi:hypothetical protein